MKRARTKKGPASATAISEKAREQASAFLEQAQQCLDHQVEMLSKVQMLAIAYPVLKARRAGNMPSVNHLNEVMSSLASIRDKLEEFMSRVSDVIEPHNNHCGLNLSDTQLESIMTALQSLGPGEGLAVRVR